MSFSLTSSIAPDGTIDCLLHSDQETLVSPQVAFSLMVPPKVLDGGDLVRSVGSWAMIRLAGTVSPQTPLAFRLGYQDPGFRTANRAWLPLGVYLRRTDGSTVPVQTAPGGVRSPVVEPQTPDGLGLVPVPQTWEPSGEVAPVHTIAIQGNPDARAQIEALDGLASRCGLPSLFHADGMPLTLETCSAIPEEGYRLDLKPHKATLTAKSATGVWHGLVSLLVLRAVHQGQVPCGVISDHPRFEWRGQHLDCARHFYKTASIERLLDLMALLKLNRFHWHFSDDEAFRLEVECFPDLWKKSAFRGEKQTLPGLFGGGIGPEGGTYSRADAAGIVAHASQLGIEVLPEIEVPAHALAVTEIYPDLRDPADTGSEQSVQGYHRNTVNPALPQTWVFLEILSAEVAGLFPMGHLHIGGDELPPETWAGSPAVDALKRDHDLSDHVDVQGYTMHRLASHLRSRGVVPCAWEEAALGNQGGIGHDAILFSWTGQGAGLDAARRGYRVVMCPAQHTYWDMARTTDTEDWGANWAANFDLAETLNWDPIPADEPELARSIIGVQGAFWGEFTTLDQQMEAMIAPRILGLSCMGWSARDAISPDRLTQLALGFQLLFSSMNWETNGHELI